MDDSAIVNLDRVFNSMDGRAALWVPKFKKVKFGHSLIRGVLIQSCPAGAKNFTNYVFCHVQFSGVIQNIENRCAIRAKF